MGANNKKRSRVGPCATLRADTRFTFSDRKQNGNPVLRVALSCGQYQRGKGESSRRMWAHYYFETDSFSVLVVLMVWCGAWKKGGNCMSSAQNGRRGGERSATRKQWQPLVYPCNSNGSCRTFLRREECCYAVEAWLGYSSINWYLAQSRGLLCESWLPFRCMHAFAYKAACKFLTILPVYGRAFGSTGLSVITELPLFHL